MRTNRDKLLPKYLFYSLNTEKVRTLIKSSIVGSIIKGINMKELLNIEIYLPTLSVQKQIIDIIEPVENLENNILMQLNLINKILKYYGSKNNNGEEIGKMVKITKNKCINSQEIIDLSKIKNDSLIMEEFSSSINFNTNKFSTKKYDFYISSIRPALKKYGISIKDMDILGTLINIHTNENENLGLILSCLCSKNFINTCKIVAKGTKMPVISWNDIKNFKCPVFTDDEKSFLNDLVFHTVELNTLLTKTKEIKTKMINLLVK
jgi:type I restriction enzyme S subunit